MPATALPALCICLPRHLAGVDYMLHFPVSELENAIALCGWTLANDLPKGLPGVAAALAKAEAKEELLMPDGPAWLAQYATRIGAAPATQQAQDIDAAERLYIRGYLARSAFVKMLARIR